MSQYGLITLNISAVIYLFWLCPQVLLNFRRKNTDGLSLIMHMTLYLGTFTDLLYGFGTVLQWQYKMVATVNFLTLTLQHLQFNYYGLHSVEEKKYYKIFSLFLPPLLLMVVAILYFKCCSRNFYDFMGLFTSLCWVLYLIPQILKNYHRQSTLGLSSYFVVLSIFLNLCDFTSAWLLSWDYPSKIGPVISLTGNLILLTQIFYYGKQHTQLVDHRRWQTAI